MGQKVHPHGLRVGVIQDWDSKWYADSKNFGDSLVEDYKVREYIKKTHFDAGVAKIEIEKPSNRLKINVHVAKPAFIIGKKCEGIEKTKAQLRKMTGKVVDINIVEIKNPDAVAVLVAENIAAQLEKRISFRRAMKQAMSRTTKAGAKGIKCCCSGRLGGAEIARSEQYHEGTIPLQTIRADIDYGFAEADTTFGKIGVKVWIYKGEVLPGSNKKKGENK
jgi:small subunit ribosomal protein S3